MDKKTHRIFSIALYVSLLVGAIVLCFNNRHNTLLVLALYTVSTGILVYINMRFYIEGGYNPAGKIFLAIELVLALLIQYFDHTQYEGFYYFILIATALMKYESKFSFPYSILAVLLCYTTLLYQYDFVFALFWKAQAPFLIPRALIIGAILLARYAIQTSHRNNILAKQLQIKSEELEQALTQLRAQMKIIEETADLRAREQLMRELHDNLGHMLATAHISAQATGVLLKKDANQAQLRLDTTVTQIQSAMHSLRDVIAGRTISQSDDGPGLIPQLKSLISETYKCTQIPISYDLPEENRLCTLDNKLRVFIYNALMEGLTNGIRHGMVTQFDFHLEQTDKQIVFCLHDNGKGFDTLTAGYGLSKMRNDAAKLGAGLTISGQNGCTLQIIIPYSKEA